MSQTSTDQDAGPATLWRSGWDRLRQRGLHFLLPSRASNWVLITASATLAINMLLVLTGGLVRLTGSGLGCSTWPQCTEGSWTPTPEMGAHGMIEFGNRLIAVLLAVVAILTWLAVLRLRRDYPRLYPLATVLAIGVPVQAVLGGLTVRTELNPWVVGVHFVLSAVLIALAAIYLGHARRAVLRRAARAERAGQVLGASAVRLQVLTVAIGGVAMLTVYIGTLVTGTGPHAGDSGPVARHAFDAYLVTRLHTVPAYLLLGLAAGGVVFGPRLRWPAAVRRALVLLVLVVLTQGVVGYYQFFNGLPVAIVAVHLVGAAAVVTVAFTLLDRAYAVSAPPSVHRAGAE